MSSAQAASGSRPQVLILAENCNPEWPSLPIVGYKYARALADVADVQVATHIRNQPNIEKAADPELAGRVTFIDNEWIAKPLYNLAKWLRGGNEVAWSTNQIMAYLPYIAFERQALRHFRQELKSGDFDLVHRITPMSPTLPSYASGRTRQPFLIGPLNGNLAWPEAFRGEQKREREGLRKLRDLYRYLPYSRSTYKKAAGIMASFDHTIADLPADAAPRIVNVPEVGFDESIFHSKGRKPSFSGDGPKRFLYVGRLVPYKVPEAAVRAFIGSDILKGHTLHIVGDGPELPRLEAMVQEANAGESVIFEGRKTQAEVADFMRSSDAFVFPSIRELGAGVVVEAMACGIVCIVTDYGAPGHLINDDRGIRVPLQPLDGLVEGYRAAMESCLADPARCTKLAKAAEDHALAHFTWPAKAKYTLDYYQDILTGQPLKPIPAYN